MPLILALLALALLNVAATVKVLWENRGPRFELGAYVDDPRPRRWGQCAFVWLIPIVGACVIFKLYAPVRPRSYDIHEPIDAHPYVMQGGH